MLLPLGTAIISHEDIVPLQAMFPTERFDIFPHVRQSLCQTMWFCAINGMVDCQSWSLRRTGLPVDCQSWVIRAISHPVDCQSWPLYRISHPVDFQSWSLYRIQFLVNCQSWLLCEICVAIDHQSWSLGTIRR